MKVSLPMALFVCALVGCNPVGTPPTTQNVAVQGNNKTGSATESEGTGNKASTITKNESKGAAFNLKPHFSRSVADFAKEFDDNATEADGKYDEKIVELVGKVSSVGYMDFGLLGGLIFRAVGTNGTWTVNVNIGESDEPKCYRLSKDQKVKVVARYKLRDGFLISLTKGVLEPLEPSQAIKVNSETLLSEYRKNAADASAKYNKKTVLVTGEVVEFQAKNGGAHVKLKGVNGDHLHVESDFNYSYPKAQIKSGMKIVVRSDFILHDEEKSTVKLIHALILVEK